MSIYGGLLLATLVLSIKTGLILGASWLGRWGLVLTSFLFGSILYGLVVFFGTHQQTLIYFLDRYTFAGALLAAIFLIYLGLQEEKGAGSSSPGCLREASFRSGGDGEFAGKAVASNSSCHFLAGQPVPGAVISPALERFKYALGFLPCPLCLVALAFSVIVASSMVGTGLSRLGLFVAVLFFILVIVTSLAMRRAIRLTGYKPVAIFNPLLLFTGLMTLIFALFIPNFVQAMTMPLTPVNIDSPRWLAAVLAGLVVLSLAGYFRYQINFLKERDD
ncbi:DUF2162 domain-containing protein [Desulfofundulus sp. TPOSR]|uniref:DUF2162 domain-containing protein n=1 Tax=Desulfofundulus sp. TPOSR TaxID=2714340 RepID=UPI00140D9524|nr:DUF2162 domain-containing protein [Desulfofundulus sp. TPOSR]NHM27595.1 DUF2162 domain-containing protein [Desulfofundulus sp. TPOSR]